MKPPVYLLFLAAVILFSAACVKGPTLDDELLSTRRYLINGKWLLTSTNTKVYDVTAIVKDTTVSYVTPSKYASMAWYYTFNRDSTVYITSLPYTKTGSPKVYTDTTSRLRYIFNGENVIFSDATSKLIEQDRIVNLSGYKLEFTNSYSATPPAGWGLDASKHYVFIVDQTFVKQ